MVKHCLFNNYLFNLQQTTTMISQISRGVKVSVETYYQPEYSNPFNCEFMFAYKITIENHNEFPIRLISRHWFIYDSNGSNREVQGEGVVGIQPVIMPGTSYQYISGCNLRSEMGKMNGSYLFENVNSNKTFDVVVPSFQLIADFKLN